MESAFSRFIDFCRADWAPACERAARLLAVAIVTTYAAGYAAGRWLHRLNDRLTAFLVRTNPPGHAVPAWAIQAERRHRATAKPAVIIRRPQAAATVATRPAAIQSPPLDTLTVAQLRTLARNRLGSAARIGGRRIAQARRAELLGALA